MAKREPASGLNQPFQDIFSPPMVASRAPTGNDRNYELGQVWINKSAGTAYILTAVASGSATWTLGSQLFVQGGAATDNIGQATLSSGTVTVAHTGIAATDRIFLTRSDLNSATEAGVLEAVITPSTNFVINSRDPSDATIATGDVSIVDYFIVRQA